MSVPALPAAMNSEPSNSLKTSAAGVNVPAPARAGGERPAAAVEFEGGVVAFFTEAAGLLGVPKSVAAIYGLTFASPEPLTFAQIEERLDLSKGSVSQGLRVLREIGALKVVQPKLRSANSVLAAFSPQPSALNSQQGL